VLKDKFEDEGELKDGGGGSGRSRNDGGGVKGRWS
jgi:hypothetical protein